MWLTKHLRRALVVSPGLLDAGASSLAGFVGSFYAARYLPIDVLGAYALYWTGSQVAGVIPQQLLFLPARVYALQLPVSDRASIVPWSIGRGLGLSGPTALFVLLAALPVAGQMQPGEMLPLTITAVLFCAVSPIQDHLRATFHLSMMSWVAGAMASVQLLTQVLVVLALHSLEVERAWIPFGSLVVANILSSLLGLLLLRKRTTRVVVAGMSARQLMTEGRVLAGAELIAVGSGYVASLLVAVVVSAEALGYAEAARVVSQPIFVFSLGLSQITVPRLMQSGFERSREKAKRYSVLTLSGICAFAAIYIAWTGWAHWLNPAMVLVPIAFVLPGLVLARQLGFVAFAAAQIPVSILYGARRNMDVLKIKTVGAVSQLVVVVSTVGLLGAYVLPAAMLMSSIVRLFHGARKCRDHLVS